MPTWDELLGLPDPRPMPWVPEQEFLTPDMTGGMMPALELPPQVAPFTPNYLDRLGLAFQNLPPMNPSAMTPGGALVAGLMQGFGAARGGSAQRQMAQVQQENARLAESARLMAQQRWRQQMLKNQELATKARNLQAQAQAQRDAARDRRSEDYLGLARAEAERSAKRLDLAEGAAARAEATAGRSAGAAERANRLAEFSIYDRLLANVRQDTDIMAYTGVKSNLRTAEASAAERTGPGDVGLIYSWHRSLEPDKPNVVREGDVKLTREAISALQRFYAVPARMFKGNLLTDAGRQYFLSQLRSALKARRVPYERALEQHKGTAKSYDIPWEQVIREIEAEPEKIRMRTPDGRTVEVPPEKEAEALRRGAVRF